MATATKGKFWTEERAERCRALWADGWSAGQIGAELGCSRNAVMSKIHRSGWTQRSDVPKALQRPPQASRRGPRKRQPTTTSNLPARPVASAGPLAAVPDEFVPEPVRADAFVVRFGPGKTLLDIGPGECRWPTGEGNDFLFCAAAQADGPYCRAHALLAFQPGAVGRQRRTVA
jgi:GcrA cell cycle regulator